MRRRTFLLAPAGLGACAADPPPRDSAAACPAFLRRFASQYANSPRGAALEWFKAATCGLFVDYGFPRQSRADAALGEEFDPAGFDAGAITDVALAAGMAYVGMTARHADGFSLFRTVETEFNSLQTSGRDLVGELAQTCRNKGLGLLLAYSYAADWRHPYFFPPEAGGMPRPNPAARGPESKFRNDEDFLHYIRYAHNQLEEIAYRYRPIAAIRLEPLEGYFARPDLFPVGQAYDLLREAREETLVAFGRGADGTEDFASVAGEPPAGLAGVAAADRAWALNRTKPIEIRRRPDPVAAGAEAEAAAGLMRSLRAARSRPATLSVGVRLRPDGSLHPPDEAALRAFGRLREAEPGPSA